MSNRAQNVVHIQNAAENDEKNRVDTRQRLGHHLSVCVSNKKQNLAGVKKTQRKPDSGAASTECAARSPTAVSHLSYWAPLITIRFWSPTPSTIAAAGSAERACAHSSSARRHNIGAKWGEVARQTGARAIVWRVIVDAFFSMLTIVVGKMLFVLGGADMTYWHTCVVIFYSGRDRFIDVVNRGIVCGSTMPP